MTTGFTFTPPMKPVLSTRWPEEMAQWVFEPKWDGYRMQLLIDRQHIALRSMHNHDYSHAFPEIITAAKRIAEKLHHELPIVLDGEMTMLDSALHCRFDLLVKRANRKTQTNDDKATLKATFCVFDLLSSGSISRKNEPLITRKTHLKKLAELGGFADPPKRGSTIALAPTYTNYAPLWKDIIREKGEGVVAKKRHSLYVSGRSDVWKKYKNWQKVAVVIIAETETGYFKGVVLQNGAWVSVCTIRHGMSPEEATALSAVLKNNPNAPPSIVLEVLTIGYANGALRDVRFSRFLPHRSPHSCTFTALTTGLAYTPDVTRPEKILWPKQQWTKNDYVQYMKSVAFDMMSFLHGRALTVVRWPNGVNEASFYQKHTPAYAPQTVKQACGEPDGMICLEMDGLLWLANQAAIEFHAPFHRDGEHHPRELVIDIDPYPSAPIEKIATAALQIKALFDSFSLFTFVKSSGSRGLQLYIPLQPNVVSYVETRLFMEAVAELLLAQAPNLWTIERRIDRRGNKMYLDYVQHHPKKTIIAPYSCRGREEGYVATPLSWTQVERHELFHSQKDVLEQRARGHLPFLQMDETRQKTQSTSRQWPMLCVLPTRHKC
ncbi:DNA ligase D [Bacillaceae bacterium SIJ1]|uniref:DNA ligase D n=1 Tax=Litoribacterium kuwaitense TaxID=1398745 RepID=UPI0013EACD8D|nr:DNA ligase D [Litoribacterium kuwaitense]NGP43750.1 DNA ligase D [Litoribacterium kuwaitense]